MSRIWNKLDTAWPVQAGGNIGLTQLRTEMAGFIERNGVKPIVFSHYGIAVDSIELHLKWLADHIENKAGLHTEKVKVEAYNVYVTRIDLDGVELELIEPYGGSFFKTHHEKFGNSVHHLSFRVADATDCLEKFSEGGVELIDKMPRRGAHGKVAFMKPFPPGSLYLEICQQEQ